MTQSQRELEALRGCATGGQPYGSDTWVDRMTKRFGLGKTRGPSTLILRETGSIRLKRTWYLVPGSTGSSTLSASGSKREKTTCLAGNRPTKERRRYFRGGSSGLRVPGKRWEEVRGPLLCPDMSTMARVFRRFGSCPSAKRSARNVQSPSPRERAGASTSATDGGSWVVGVQTGAGLVARPTLRAGAPARLASEMLGRRMRQARSVREFKAVGNGLRAVPVRSVAPRNGTEAVPYSGFQRFEFPDTLR